LNQLVDLNEMYGDDAIAGDVDALTFNPIASTILKWLQFKVVGWMHYLHHSAMLSSGMRLFSIVGFHGYITYNF
jgi:hypothetical protein